MDICHFAPVFPYRPELTRKRPQEPQGPKTFPRLETDWVVEFETFYSTDRKAQLFSHLFRPEHGKPELAHRALIVLHGQGEHSGRYGHWPHFLKDHVGSIYAIDHRGHGQSTGIRGHVEHFDSYAHDAAAAVRRYAHYLQKRYGQAEIHLLGHSMGGLIALRATLLHDLPIKSVILSAPLIELALPLGRFKIALGRLLAQVLPFLPLPSAPMAQFISRDPAVVEHYKNDPLNHSLASPAFYFSYLAAKADTWKRAKQFKKPLLFLLPMADHIVKPEGTEQLFNRIVAPEKKLLRYADCYHELFNEAEKDKAFKDLIAWLHSHQN